MLDTTATLGDTLAVMPDEPSRACSLPISARLARGRVPSLVIFAAFFACAVLLQVWMGAFNVERGFYSDDAAHFMNGLVIRDYVYQAFGTNPVRFAEQYYLSYPKIAPLMWPPLFHVVLGVWLLPGWPAAPASLLLISLATAWTAWRLERMVRVLAGWTSALVAAAL